MEPASASMLSGMPVLWRPNDIHKIIINYLWRKSRRFAFKVLHGSRLDNHKFIKYLFSLLSRAIDRNSRSQFPWAFVVANFSSWWAVKKSEWKCQRLQSLLLTNKNWWPEGAVFWEDIFNVKLKRSGTLLVQPFHAKDSFGNFCWTESFSNCWHKKVRRNFMSAVSTRNFDSNCQHYMLVQSA